MEILELPLLKTEINIKLPLVKMVPLQIIVDDKPRTPKGSKYKYFTKMSTQKLPVGYREETIRNF